MERALPPPIRFTLTASERDRVAEFVSPRARRRRVLAWIQLVASVTVAALGFALYGPRSPIPWVYVVMVVLVAIAMLPLRPALGRCAATAEPVDVEFSETSLETRAAARKPAVRAILLRSVRAVEIAAGAVIVFDSSDRRDPALVIPLDAFPAGPDAVMRYFDDRLVAKRMLRRGSSASTTIVNTALR